MMSISFRNPLLQYYLDLCVIRFQTDDKICFASSIASIYASNALFGIFPIINTLSFMFSIVLYTMKK